MSLTNSRLVSLRDQLAIDEQEELNKEKEPEKEPETDKKEKRKKPVRQSSGKIK